MKRYTQTETRIFGIRSKRRKLAAVTMNGADFRAVRTRLNLTQDEMGRVLGLPGCGYTKRTVIAWELDENKIPPAVEKLMLIMLENKKLMFFAPR